MIVTNQSYASNIVHNILSFTVYVEVHLDPRRFGCLTMSLIIAAFENLDRKHTDCIPTVAANTEE